MWPPCSQGSANCRAASIGPPLHLSLPSVSNTLPAPPGFSPDSRWLSLCHDSARPHPQLLHHRPHRPRQIDPGRPPPPDDAAPSRSGRCRTSCSTTWTSSASGGSPSRRAPCASSTRRRTAAALPVQPDRHPRARRLRLRGVAQPRRLRGGAAGGRRRQGVEAQTLANAYLAIERQPRPGAGHQQDRPPRRRSRARQGADRERRRHRRPRRRAGLGQGGDRHRGDAGADRPRHPAAAGRPRRRRSRRCSSTPGTTPTAASSAWCGWSTARCASGHKIQFMATGRAYEIDELGVFSPEAEARSRRSRRRRGRLLLRRHQGHRSRRKIGDTITDASRPTAAAFPGFKEVKPMVFAGLFPVDRRRLRGPARRRGEAAAERRLLLLRAGELGRARLRVPLRLPRACSTWRSSRSGWSASSTSS